MSWESQQARIPVHLRDSSRDSLSESWLMENGVVNWGKEGKGHGIEGSANANDVWVWIRPHIGFFTIENCDLLSFFLLIVSPSSM
jgi:hypothetical protein